MDQPTSSSKPVAFGIYDVMSDVLKLLCVKGIIDLPINKSQPFVKGRVSKGGPIRNWSAARYLNNLDFWILFDCNDYDHPNHDSIGMAIAICKPSHNQFPNADTLRADSIAVLEARPIAHYGEDDDPNFWTEEFDFSNFEVQFDFNDIIMGNTPNIIMLDILTAIHISFEQFHKELRFRNYRWNAEGEPAGHSDNLPT